MRRSLCLFGLAAVAVAQNTTDLTAETDTAHDRITTVVTVTAYAATPTPSSKTSSHKPVETSPPAKNAELIQLDLVFPRPDELYRPVYPFPIVFAIHNLAKAWQYRPGLRWTLESKADARDPSQYLAPSQDWNITEPVDLGSWGSLDSTNAAWYNTTGNTTLTDPTVFIFSTSKIANHTTRNFTLHYALNLQNRCEEYDTIYKQWNTTRNNGTLQASDGKPYDHPPYMVSGSITFATSNTGQMPNITAHQTADPLGLISILGTSPRDSACALVQDAFVNATVEMKIDKKLGEDVAKEMAARTHCPGNWPNADMKHECSGAGVTKSSYRGLLSLIAIPVLVTPAIAWVIWG